MCVYIYIYMFTDAEHGIGIDWNGNDTYVDER